jgi:porin
MVARRAGLAGDLWSRPALAGDWGGVRNALAMKGLNLDVDLVQGVLGLNTGGSFRNHDSLRYPYGGHAEYRLNVDTGKLGLWPGGFLSILGENQFGSYLFLAQWFGIYLGKLDTFGGDMNAFAHEWKTQFMNTGFGPNPVLFQTFSYSTLGAGLIVLPTEAVQFTFTAASPGGTANSAGFSTLFEEGVVLDAELRVGIRPFGLPGHQLLGGIWSSQTFTSAFLTRLRVQIKF